MTKVALAQQLRKRQHKVNKFSLRMLATVSDDDMIASYITCAGCGEVEIEGEELDRAIANASDANEFLQLLDHRDLLKGHSEPEAIEMVKARL
jgi:hypothetical protein